MGQFFGCVGVGVVLAGSPFCAPTYKKSIFAIFMGTGGGMLEVLRADRPFFQSVERTKTCSSGTKSNSKEFYPLLSSVFRQKHTHKNRVFFIFIGMWDSKTADIPHRGMKIYKQITSCPANTPTPNSAAALCGYKARGQRTSPPALSTSTRACHSDNSRSGHQHNSKT